MVPRAETRAPKLGGPNVGVGVGWRRLAWSPGCCPITVGYTPALGVGGGVGWGDFGALIFYISALSFWRSDLDPKVTLQMQFNFFWNATFFNFREQCCAILFFSSLNVRNFLHWEFHKGARAMLFNLFKYFESPLK